MILKLGTVMSHLGQPTPESDPWGSLHALGIDVDLAKRAAHKLYFEYTGEYTHDFAMRYDVMFVPNETEHSSMFVLRYGGQVDAINQ